jgi:hypothetical protein
MYGYVHGELEFVCRAIRPLCRIRIDLYKYLGHDLQIIFLISYRRGFSRTWGSLEPGGRLPSPERAKKGRA